MGGFVKEYQVLVDPNRLRAYDVPLHRIVAAVKAASQEVGGRVIEQGEMEMMIRSKGYITNLKELRESGGLRQKWHACGAIRCRTHH